jgi:hypothetical protein
VRVKLQITSLSETVSFPRSTERIYPNERSGVEEREVICNFTCKHNHNSATLKQNKQASKSPGYCVPPATVRVF